MTKSTTKFNAHVLPKSKNCLLRSISGLALSLLGLLCGIFWQNIFDAYVDKIMTMRPNSKIYDVWKDPPMKLTLDFYLFNWTNPDDFHNHSTKPILQELGPYRFTEKQKKVDIHWHPENASVSYRRQSAYFFDEENSQGKLTDQITTVNSLAVTIGAKARYWDRLRRGIIDFAMRVYRNDLRIKRTVDELLFKGFDDVLLDLAGVVPKAIIDVFVPFDKMGYCYPRNNSADFYGVFNIHTGADDIQNVGKLHAWKNQTETNYFPKECAQVRGSSGEFMPPKIKPNVSLEYFVPDLCRPVMLDYEKEVIVEGVPGYRYVGGKRSVDNGTIYAENACYCNGKCVRSGLMNITSCWFGATLFMSYPHFYNADEFYIQQVEGMQPQKHLHEFFVVLEPKTGALLEFSIKYQANMLVERLPQFGIFRNARETFFPLVWFEETGRITPELAIEFKLMPYAEKAGIVIAILITFIGVVLIFSTQLHQLWRRQRGHERESINLSEERFVDKFNGDLLASPAFPPLLQRSTIISSDNILPTSLSLDSDDINTDTTESLASVPSNNSKTSLRAAC